MGWQLWWTDLVAARGQDQEQASLTQEFQSAAPPRATEPSHPTDPKASPRVVTFRTDQPRTGRGFAIIRIPRFGADWSRPLVQGTGHDELANGIGHEPGTAMPGQIGNLVTAGHRVTYGKPYNRIDELRRGDAIVVETADGWAVYRYRRYVIVEPDDVSVTEAVPERPGVQPTEAWMTLIACHPPFSARQRYVGFAKLESLTPRARQVPAEVAAALRVPGEG